MEQKHTPEEVVKGYNSISMIATKQWITKRVYNRLYVSVPIENSTNHHAIAQVYDEEYAELIRLAPELLEQVSALTKENERLKAENLLLLLRDQDIDRLREENSKLKDIISSYEKNEKPAQTDKRS